MVKTATTIIVLASCIQALFAQVAPISRSNALDASPQLGAGGANSPVRQNTYGNYNTSSFGNLYITGNVTGGKSFRGFVPYRDPTQFQNFLGSSDLNTFERGTMDLSRVQQGYLGGQALPYYNSSSTILPLSAQRQGLTVPGSLTPRYQVLPQSESFGLRAALPRPVVQPSTPLPPNVRATDILVPGILVPQQAELKPEERTPYEQLNAPKAPPKELPEKEVPQPSPAPENLLQPQPHEPEAPPSDNAPAQDYTQWLELQADKAEKPARAYLGPRAEFAEAAKRMGGETKTPNPAKAGPVEGVGQKSKVPVVTDLAGKGKDAFSRSMRSAQELLVRGNFYDAYQQYTDALALRPEDPLPLFGQADALLAAGDLRSAAEHLQRAMQKFPKFVFLRLDGSRLLGSRAVLERRRQQLQSLTTKNTDQRPLMLLRGYVELLAGNRETGLQQIIQSGLVPLQ